ncbi:MAG: hypothetical protein WBN30_03475, partial [Polyangiales bacterium]
MIVVLEHLSCHERPQLDIGAYFSLAKMAAAKYSPISEHRTRWVQVIGQPTRRLTSCLSSSRYAGNILRAVECS